MSASTAVASPGRPVHVIAPGPPWRVQAAWLCGQTQDPRFTTMTMAELQALPLSKARRVICPACLTISREAPTWEYSPSAVIRLDFLTNAQQVHAELLALADLAARHAEEFQVHYAAALVEVNGLPEHPRRGRPKRA